MSGNNNIQINAAYVASWKTKNLKLLELKTDGHFLTYQNKKIDISEIYMQDILMNSNTFNFIYSMEAKDLFRIIELHTHAIQMKEKELENKVRKIKEYESTTFVQSSNENFTVEEYFEILKKDIFTSKEINQKNIFENYIKKCEEYSLYLSPAVESIYSEYKKQMAALFTKENLTPFENEVLIDYQTRLSETDKGGSTEEDDYIKKLAKAGYINATIILVMILNIGFIIAMALLGRR